MENDGDMWEVRWVNGDDLETFWNKEFHITFVMGALITLFSYGFKIREMTH